MQIEGGGSAKSNAAAAAAEAARRAAEAARAAAEARAKAAAEARAKAAAEAAAEAAQQRAEAAKDKAPTSMLDKFKEATKKAATSAVEALPWDKPTSMFSKVKDFVAGFAKADQAKTDTFMSTHGPAFGPAGQAGLEKLAGAGTLSAIDKNWGNLRDNLESHLKSGQDPALAEGIVAQIANPDAITQMTENGCAAATLQKSLAEANPGQYFKIVSDLATQGEATLENGQKLTLSPENQQAITAQNLPTGEHINAVFQAAAMDYANGSHTYDAKEDRSKEKTADTDISYAGLNITQAAKLNEALLGTPTVDQGQLGEHIDKRIEQQADKDQDDKVGVFGLITEGVKEQFDKAKEDGAPGIFLTLNMGSERVGPPQLGDTITHYHMVMVKDMDDQGNVTVVDANGQEKTMSQDQFGNSVSQSNADDAYGGIGNTGTQSGTSGSVSAGGRRR